MDVKKVVKSLIPYQIIQHKLHNCNSVLFTFDDGPHPEITYEVLDILERNNAKGLFFIVGNKIQRAPDVLKHIVERGHGIGNHSFSHTSCSCLSLKQIIHEIEETKKIIRSLTGITTRIYRPPMGVISINLIVAAKITKHNIMRWSIDSGEYSYLRNKTPESLATNLLNKIHHSSIILSHDDISVVPNYLKLALPQLIEKGYDLSHGIDRLIWR